MKRITVVTGGHLSTSPRMLKAADAFAQAGYRVRVVCVRHTDWASEADRSVMATRSWDLDVVDYSESTARVQQLLTGARHRAAVAAARFIGAPNAPVAVAARACGRAHDELVRAASEQPCDFIYGGTLPALAATAEAARRLGVPYALDLEDFHSGEQENPDDGVTDVLADRIEHDILRDAAFLTAGSPMIADAYAAKYRLHPIPVHNTFSIGFRAGDEANGASPVRAYWFSQTIGGGRGLDDVVRAFGSSRAPAELHLRGRAIATYLDHLMALQRQAAPSLRIVHHDPLAPDDMVRAAQPYHAGLSCEEPVSINHRLCLGNKIFTYLAAGVPVILSRTPAQARLAEDLGPAAFTYEPGDVDGLAAVLGRLSTSEPLRRQASAAARSAATRRWHWEHPLDRGALIDLVRASLPSQ
jgi:glycosyltransferase involved in cell wall biosynthesis